MKFNKDVCKILFLGWHNQGPQSSVGVCVAGQHFDERDLGSWWTTSCSDVSAKANLNLGCIHRGITVWQTESGAGLSTLPVAMLWWTWITGSNSGWVQYITTCCMRQITYYFFLALQCNRSFIPVKTRPDLVPNIPGIWPYIYYIYMVC